MKLAFIFVAFFGSFSHALVESKNSQISTQDLKNLEKKKDWAQLTNLIDRVPVALRDDDWRKLLKSGSLGLFEGVADGDLNAESFLRAESLLTRVPDVAEDREFMNRRGQLGVTYYETCFQKEIPKDTCEKMIRAFAEKDIDNHELQLRVGRIFREPLGDKTALFYFDRALVGEADRSFCGDSGVRLAVINTLGFPLGKGNENLAEIRPAIRIAFHVCFNDWHETLAEIYAKDRVHFQYNTCHFMKERGAITLAQGKRCAKIEWFPKKVRR